MKFVDDSGITTDDFWYDLFDGGYIKPEELLVDKNDIEKVKSAISVLEDFKEQLEENGIIELI